MEIYSFLDEHSIEFDRHDHPPVFTCEEANELIPDLPGAKTKNLFVRDKKGKRHFLIVVPDEKQVDLVALSKQIQTTRLSMGSPERLEKYLGIQPGSVSLLAVINDHDGAVQVILDESISEVNALQCHPLVNTSTLVISRGGIQRLLEASNHRAIVLDIPAKHS